MQAKLDGWRVTFFKQECGKVVAYGGEIRDDLEMMSRFDRLRLDLSLKSVQAFIDDAPPLSSLDCEAWVPGRPASIVPTALRSAELELKVTPFAVPWWDGADLTVADALDVVNRFRPMFEFADTFEYEELTDGVEDHAKSLLANAKARGIEGWILKDYNYANWWKLKESNTCDCIVVDVKEGNGKYAGLVGALIVALNDGSKQKVVANVSGMSDTERVEITELDNDGKLLGRVVEVEYQYVGERGKLRHPRFVRFREDKPAVECMLDQLT